MTRKTLDRTTLVHAANRMLEHLAPSGTHADTIRREAIISLTSAALLDANAYKGFRYLNPPTVTASGNVYDETRIAFN